MNIPVAVLIVEDDSEIRELAALILRDAGYAVLVASDGGVALQLIVDRTFQVILLDMQMPTMDGWAFVAAYRSRFAYNAPIVVMSAAPEAAAWAKQIGADAQVKKPFDVDVLLATVTRVSCFSPNASAM